MALFHQRSPPFPHITIPFALSAGLLRSIAAGSLRVRARTAVQFQGKLHRDGLRRFRSKGSMVGIRLILVAVCLHLNVSPYA